jgi:Type II secretion system (T2SS), protein M subtype b
VRELPQGPTGRALALAIGALGVAIFYFLVVSPILYFYDDQAQIVQQRAEMAQRFKVLARDLPDLRTADRKWRDQFGGELLLTGQSDAIASAAIQSMMKSTVEGAGARLTSAEILPERTEGEFRRVGIRVAFAGDLKLIASVLRNLETAHPVLFAGDFDLQAGSDAGRQDAASAGSNSLAVTLDVYGFRAG